VISKSGRIPWNKGLKIDNLKRPPLKERFWNRVDVREDKNSCWEWLGPKQFNRGRVRIGSQVDDTRKLILPHRIAYELTYGPIPKGLFVCHHCDNPPCCNPIHLFLGTQRDNMQDAVRKGRKVGRPKKIL